MSKITSKLQLTLPKAIADRYGIRPGDEVTWTVSEDTIRLVPAKKKEPTISAAQRLRLFDRATERQEERNAQRRAADGKDRGWTREELYDRGRAR